jgi:hypothetical protein
MRRRIPRLWTAPTISDCVPGLRGRLALAALALAASDGLVGDCRAGLLPIFWSTS